MKQTVSKGNLYLAGLTRNLIFSATVTGTTAFTGTAVAAGVQDTSPTIEEIIITAQKRAENLQDVPLAITAISENFIAEVGAQSVNDLGLYVPGLETRVVQPTQPAFNIRGITTDDFGIGADPAVAVYVDGVYSGRSGAAMTAFQDVARVEVLKGPQGTLFGKNAAAGAIHIINNVPVENFESNLSVELGNYNKHKVDAMLNVPLASNLFLRVNAMDMQRDGYRTNAANGDELADENQGGARAALLWQANDTTDVTLQLEYFDVDQDSGITYGLINGGDPYGDAFIDSPVEEALTLWGGSLTVKSDFDGMSLTSITAGRTFDSNNLRDEDGTAIFPVYFTSENIEENTFFSQEVRLVSTTTGKLRWTTGAMISYEDGEQDSALVFSTDLVDRSLLGSEQGLLGLAQYNEFSGQDYTPQTAPPGFGWDMLLDPNFLNWGTPQGIGQSTILGGFFRENAHADLKSTSTAIYGDATYSLTEKLDLTVGLRYTRDEKDFTLTINPNEFGFGVAFTPTPGVKQSNTWNNLSSRLVLDYALSDSAMLYTSYTTGYKAGGFNSTELSNAFDEENVANFELGLKSLWLDQSLRFNTVLFHYEYTDLQDLVTVENPTTGINEPRIRSVDAEGQGLELDLQWRVAEPLTLDFNYTYIDSEITRFGLFDTETAADDRTGEPQSSVAKNKFNLGAQYRLVLADVNEFEFRLGYTYVGKRKTFGLGGATPEAQALMDVFEDDLDGAYKNLDARITYRDARRNWQVSLYGQNLTDEEYLYNMGGFGASIGTPIADRAPPRFYGITGSYSF